LGVKKRKFQRNLNGQQKFASSSNFGRTANATEKEFLMKSIIAAFAFLALIAASGCSQATPSDSQAREILMRSSGFFTMVGAKMVDFRKLNGVPMERRVKMYEYDFLSAFELPPGIAWVNRASGFVLNSTQGHGLPKGTLAIKRGLITFQLSEKGWIGPVHVDAAEYSYCTPPSEPSDCYAKLGWDKPDSMRVTR
jgi:hypothetical protein